MSFNVLCFSSLLEWLLMRLGHLADRYECLLWQENCCTIFLYWAWALPSEPPAPSRRNDCDWPAPMTLVQSCIIALFLCFCFVFLLFQMNHTAMLWTLSQADCCCRRVAIADTPTLSSRSCLLLCDSRPLSLCSILSAPPCESWRYMSLCKSP